MKLSFLERIKKGPILFDGGFGTELYKRGVFLNKCFEELNLSNKQLIKDIHSDYIKAGAEVITTNTFGGNRFKLRRQLLHENLKEINFNAASIAREVAGNSVYVAGSVGPLGIQIEPLGPISREEAIEFFKEQLIPLIDGGIDIILFETFIYPDELKCAVKAAREVTNLPVIAQMTINEHSRSLTGASPEIMIREMESFGADIIGVNCSVGPRVMLNWLEEARKYTDKYISVMPNAGKPKNIDGRNIYLTSPEYLGEYAKHYIQTGADIIGGCCGTGPEHIKKNE